MCVAARKYKKLKVKLPESTEGLEVPKRVIDQVIGQDEAVEIVRRAALQRRHVLLIGKPGTGKSMLAQGMSELLPSEDLEDILVFPNPENENEPILKAFPAGFGRSIVHKYREKANAVSSFRKTLLTVLMVAVAVITFYYTFILRVPQALFSGIIAAAFLMIIGQQTRGAKTIMVPKLIVGHRPGEKAPFVDATGAHEGSLLGDVRHDPFQSGGLETPSHDRVEPGDIHKAHRGVLFIDEIATLAPKMQVDLLTAMQEKKYPITGRSERSAGAMVKTTPAPCDFVLVAAGNVETIRKINPALRSRIQGYGYEVFMNETIGDTKGNEQKIVRFIAQEVAKDKKIPHFSREAISHIIYMARHMADRKDHLTLRLRELGGVVRAAGDLAKEDGAKLVKRRHVEAARESAKPFESQMASRFIERKKEYQVITTEGEVVGRVNGLAVIGDAGIVLPIEAEVVPGSGDRSEVIATGNLGKIAKEAVSNVAAIIRKWFGRDLKKDYDIYIQFLQTYEGVEGDSASVAVATAVVSSVNRLPVRQEVAMTGSLSVRGDVLPVGGVNHKIEAAVEAGIKEVIIPKGNLKDVVTDKAHKVKLVPVSRLEDVVEVALVDKKGRARKALGLAKDAAATA
jgi:Lon-like ATP-dependent protease